MTPASRYIAVAVEPRLFADALTKVLEDRGYEVVRPDRDEDAEDALEDCVVVIMSDAGAPVPSTRQVVIRVPEAGSSSAVSDVQEVLDRVAASWAGEGG